MNWKIERDPYYHQLNQQYGRDFILDAGFFYDSDTQDQKLDDSLLCTPISFLEKPGTKPCVLLTTGSFCPIHYGHVQMMLSAKGAAEQAGYQVLGGYFSPSHDEYVSAKTGATHLNIHQRLDLIRAAIKDHSWMEIDPWEGIFNRVAINFTDVVERLRLYLRKYLGQDVAVFYVCGGDNARFAKTFALKGHCIIVGRPGYSPRAIEEDCLRRGKTEGRILFVDGGADISSTQLRHSLQPQPVHQKLHLRVDDTNPFENALQTRISKYFQEVTPHLLSEQRRLYARLPGNIISLDPELPGSHNLSISRHYDLFGSRMLHYGVRPGLPPLSQQLATIPSGDYTLFDDDIYTGRTVRFAKQLLEQHGIKITSVVSLNISNPDEYEILDARDFLFGVKTNGGLVISLQGHILRLPYLYPYVCPYIRGSILNPLQFSIEMWEVNALLLEETGKTLQDTPHLGTYADLAGYSPDTPLAEICWEHAARLRLFQVV